jgi:hypothetical protein
MKRLLGVDKSKNLMILASKKEKLLALSNLKISAKKNKINPSYRNRYIENNSKMKKIG